MDIHTDIDLDIDIHIDRPIDRAGYRERILPEKAWVSDAPSCSFFQSGSNCTPTGAKHAASRFE